jgi:hypothetical protein
MSKFKLIVLERKRIVFRPLTLYYKEALGRVSDSTAESYLETLYSFFTWLRTYSYYQGRTVEWDEETEAVRAAVEDYLIHEAHCKVAEGSGKTYYNVWLTKRSPSTVRKMLSALKSFYKIMIHLKMYPYINPLIDSNAILNEHNTETEGVRKGKPRMPDSAGTEEPSSKEARRLTDSYFKVINGE